MAQVLALAAQEEKKKQSLRIITLQQGMDLLERTAICCVCVTQLTAQLLHPPWRVAFRITQAFTADN